VKLPRWQLLAVVLIAAICGAATASALMRHADASQSVKT